MGITKTALRRKKAITDTHYVPATDEDLEALKFAQQRYNLAQFGGEEKDVIAAKERLDGVVAQIRKTGLVFDITSVGRVRYEEIIREHPATDAAVAKAKEKGEDPPLFNVDTFWPALCAESVAGDISAEDWKTDVFESKEWGAGELYALREKLTKVHQSTRVAELGN